VYLETERLIIRDWHPLQDAPSALDIYGDQQVTRWIGDQETDVSIQAVQGRLYRYINRSITENPGTGIWAVVEKAIDRVIGTLLLVPLPGRDGQPTNDLEIGWHFRPASWGYGYATEAARAILAYSRQQLGWSVLFAVTLPDNKRSIAVMDRLGMTCLGMTDNYYGGRPLLLYQRLLTDPNLSLKC
jgi:ribosomal-protein-alanine N-acetyltransferase